MSTPFFGPLDRQPMIAGVGFHPGLVFGGALAQDLRGRVTQTQAAQPVPSPSDAAAPLHLIEQLPVRRVALHDVVLRIDGVRLGGRRHSDPGPDANGLYLGAPPLRNQKFADSPVERDGFETSVPGERAYGLNLCLSPYGLPFSARSCSAWRARTR